MKIALGLAAASILLAACAGMSGSSPSVTAELRPASGSQVSGTVTFTQAGDRVRFDVIDGGQGLEHQNAAA